MHKKNSDDLANNYSTQKELTRMYFEFFLTLLSSIGLLLQHIYEIFVPRELKDVRGQLVLVTGGANGIGREIALNFARRGCNIAIVDIDLEVAARTVNYIRSLGVTAEAFKADVSSHEEIEKLKDAVESKLGAVDILVNNAGIFITKDITEEKPENLLRMININLMSNFWTNRVFLNGMVKRRRGHIVAVSSAAGIFGVPEGLTYSASKFGVRGFMESLAMELYHRGHSEYIKTTCIFPYFIQTSADVTNSVMNGCKHKVLFNVVDAGKRMVEGILRNEEVITIPRSYYYLLYLLNLPVGFKKIVAKKMAVENFRGLAPKTL